MSINNLRKMAIFSFIASMLVLLIGGYLSLDKIPPYPEKVLDSSGNLIFTKSDLIEGQNTYQKYGLMDHGSVWGHGTLRGPDFSALTLKLSYEKMKEFYALKYGKDYDKLSDEEKAVIQFKVKSEIRNNAYNPENKTLTLTDSQVYALNEIRKYYNELFSKGDIEKGNYGYGFLKNTVKTEIERYRIADFFFWTSWVSAVNRPDSNVSYTNNWPYFKEVDNILSQESVLWSIGGIIALLAVLGIVIYLIHKHRLYYGEEKATGVADVLIKMNLTESQLKSAKFFLVVNLLFIVQTLMGGLLAHYTTHPGSFYISRVAELIPYSLAKSWHLQLAIFWIATTWIGASIYLAPIISGKEPDSQGLLVNILFTAVVIVAVGSLVGIILGVNGKFDNDLWFWFGHQGWEYLELGRFWQILLFIGLIAWLIIVYRGIRSKLYGKEKDESGLIMFYTMSAILVVAFFGFGFFYGKGTHLTVADYWRWYVVHIWVEGIFEFFGVAIISLFLAMMGLVNKESAMRVSYFTAILVFASGIIGTAHHYFWYGGPSYWIALGSVFSSLEPIPLIVLVVRAWKEYNGVKEAGEKFPYKWPFFFLTASSFWNFLGAGVFGFMINLPIINYFEHATYLTPNHGHAALFGVYGMLSISLLLFSWRGLVKDSLWDDKIIKYVFWLLNGGLMLMVIMTLLPVGLYQTAIAYKYGFWFARSPEFYNIPVVKQLLELRIIPDTIVIAGAVLLLYFLLKTYSGLRKNI